MIVTIDGPAGAGKTTIAGKLAEKLGFHHVNSGMIYRAMTFYGLQKYKDNLPENVDEIAKFFELSPEHLKIEWSKNIQYVVVDGEELVHELTGKKINQFIKFIADSPGCRDLVTQKLNKIAIDNDLVIDGRDIGSKIFPWAEKKIFLDATVSERAKRRALEEKIKINSDEFIELKESIKLRDRNDANRKIAPLVVPENSYYMDTSGKSIDKVLEELYAYCRK